MENFIINKTELPRHKVHAVLGLLEEGATIPFIARYRKEVTGNLNEVHLEAILKWKDFYLQLTKRKEAVLKAIQEQGQLTPSLTEAINNAESLTVVEDLYAPYKKRKKTKADLAREKGYEPLAKEVMHQKVSHELTSEEVENVGYIIAEWISQDQPLKDRLRQVYQRRGSLSSKLVKKKEKEAAKYKDYFDFSGDITRQPAHRILALFRGEKEGFLKLKLQPPQEEALRCIKDKLKKDTRHPTWAVIEASLEDSYKRLLQPSLEKEFLNQLKEKADTESILVFRKNLENLLLTAPFGDKGVIGIDPGFRTGCKVVLLSNTGDLLENTAIYPLEPHNKGEEAQRILQKLLKKAPVEAIVFGNGTGGRELEVFLEEARLGVPHVMINESGASIYSASETARKEFPQQDITVRGAVSIGRRFQDPLAELVKIDPKSLGVGQYQHDVNQKELEQALNFVVDSCVNRVGVDLNTASENLLQHVSGLNSKTAGNIIAFRREKGAFKNRKMLKKVSGIGEKAFEQAAGFLRIPEGENLLDNTGVHPEQYDLISKALTNLGCSLKDLQSRSEIQKELQRILVKEVGEYTAQDILVELAKPGRDPRDNFEFVQFQEGVNSMEDLEEGMSLPGVVTNVTAFGAFVDIGVHQDGLVHISQLSDSFVQDPTDVVKVGDKVQVRVISVEIERKRISLSMKD